MARLQVSDDDMLSACVPVLCSSPRCLHRDEGGERLKPSDTMPRHRKVVAEFTSAVKNRTPDPPPPEPEELPDSKAAKKGGKQAGPPATFKKEK